ncbi:MAG: histidinol dehydrogenase [Lacipirellulaceae bacterium]
MNIERIDTSEPTARGQIAELRAKLAPEGNVVSEAGRQKTIDVFGEPLSPVQVVERICGDVRNHGIEAVLEYSQKLDGKELSADQLRVPSEALEAAHRAADPELLAAVKRISERVLEFQEAILHTDVTINVAGGGYLTQRYQPLKRIGICVPGGAAAYPSTVLMTALPAQAAGVEEIAVVAPPTEFGSYNEDLLATCHELGITEVYRMGGAQAVAALAYGVEGVPAVDKIVGPGNLFVALAKKHVFGEVDIDSIAGPSEVIVIADETARADFVAADLLAQAEHSPGSSVLITWHAPLVDEAMTELNRQRQTLERGELAQQALESFGALITVQDRAEAVELANELATEHLHVQCDDAEDLLAEIRYAGAVFVGPYSPVAVGDYAAGPSHVLPTGATARFASGLSSNDFLRTNSVIHFQKESLSGVAKDVQTLAAKEGLTAHAESVAVRLRSEKKV